MLSPSFSLRASESSDSASETDSSDDPESGEDDNPVVGAPDREVCGGRDFLATDESALEGLALEPLVLGLAFDFEPITEFEADEGLLNILSLDAPGGAFCICVGLVGLD